MIKCRLCSYQTFTGFEMDRHLESAHAPSNGYPSQDPLVDTVSILGAAQAIGLFDSSPSDSGASYSGDGGSSGGGGSDGSW